MSRVLTNDISFAYAVEQTPGVLGAAPIWKTLEPNKINSWGSQIKTVARSPISRTRQRRKGTIVDLDAAMSYDGDITLDMLRDFLSGFVFALPAGGTIFRPASVDGSSVFTIVSVTDPYVFPNSLVYARGMGKAGNIGLHLVDTVDAAVAGTAILTITSTNNAVDGETVTIGGRVYTFQGTLTGGDGHVKIGADKAATLLNLAHAINKSGGTPGTDYNVTLADPKVSATSDATSATVTARVAGSASASVGTTETLTNGSWNHTALNGGVDLKITVDEATTAEALTDSQNATLEVAGYRGVDNDFAIDSDGNLTSSGIDFTTLGLTVGQGVWIGGPDSSTSFATADDRGFARIVTIEADKLTLDKRANAFTVDSGSGKAVDLYFGQFLRNVGVDDADYTETTFQFEGAFPGLGDASETKYQYAPRNECDSLTINLPLGDKSDMTVGFIGIDVEPFTAVRKTNAASAREPVGTEAYNTAVDIARLRVQAVDESGLTTDFKTLKLTLNNNASPEKVLGTLGAKYINVGIFQVDLAGTVLFTSSDVPDAIRANDTVTMDFSLRNEDGAVLVDIPSMTLGDGKMDFPVNQSVTMNLSGIAFKDDILGTSLGVTIFPYIPAE